MAKKYVLTACCTGGVTSTIIANKVRSVAEENGIDVEVHSCKVLEIKGKVEGGKYSLIVSGTDIPDYGVPVVNGRPFLSGIKEEPTKQQIIHILNSDAT